MAETASSLQEHEAFPTLVGTAFPPEPVVETDVSEALFLEEDATEQVTFTNGDAGILHRCLGRILPTPETGFSSTAPELARQLYELLGDHMDCFRPGAAHASRCRSGPSLP